MQNKKEEKGVSRFYLQIKMTASTRREKIL